MPAVGVQSVEWGADYPKRAASAVMLCVTPDDQVVAVRSDYKPYWTVPGGIVDPGETPRECAIRETSEEIGVDVDPNGVSFVAVVDRRSDSAQTYQFIFTSPISDADVQSIRLQPGEIQAYQLVSRQEIKGKNQPFAKALEHWANGTIGYREQEFEKGA